MKLFIGITMAILVVCVLSALLAYQRGYNWGLRVQQRNALNVPGLVDVYGCGVDRFVRVDSKRGVPLHEVITSLQPLPSTVNAVFFGTNHPASFSYSATLSEALGTNGIGSWPLTGGESILLVHQFK